MAAFAALLPEFNLRAPTTPEATALLCLRRATERFCQDTWAWQEVLEDVSLDEGAVALTPPNGAETVAVTEVRLGDRWLPAVPAGEARRSASAGFWPPLGYCALDARTLVFVPWTPSDPEALRPVRVAVALQPSARAAGAPDALTTRYATALVAGALAFAATIPGALPEAAIAASFAEEYRRAVGDARRYARSGHNPDALRVSLRPFI
jgi:hypothetical protein